MANATARHGIWLFDLRAHQRQAFEAAIYNL